MVCKSLLASFASNALICVDGALLPISLRSDDVMSCKKGRMNGEMDGEMNGNMKGKQEGKDE